MYDSEARPCMEWVNQIEGTNNELTPPLLPKKRKKNRTKVAKNISYKKPMSLKIFYAYLKSIQSILSISPGVKNSHVRTFMAFAVIIMRSLLETKDNE